MGKHMLQRCYNVSIKKKISTFPKVIFHDKPVKPIVTENVNTIVLSTHQYVQTADASGKKNDISHGILLDGKLLHTPKGKVFSCNNKKLLPLLVNEWSEIISKLHRFRLLPITFCLSSHIDNKLVDIGKLLDYFENDTLRHLPFSPNMGGCTRFNIYSYYPLTFEFLKAISKISFEECSTLILSQYLNSLFFKLDTSSSDISHYINKLTSLNKTILEMLSDEYKSFILASSVIQRIVSPEIALRLSRIEETYQKSISIRNVEHKDDNLQSWIDYWQKEELSILHFINGVLACADSDYFE